ncbi:hypothetical protein [Miltoncostaea oceani]|uniref:hypothetical protein n=1 Tax=Miltoncostaea oceani TaxID=2843216 RepID=UPI001C3DB118|nr:hypothetical protein [Miltoncostaea oceani]
MLGLKTPDITPAQVVAVVGAILGVLLAAGLDISDDLRDAIILLVTVLAPTVIGGDAVIRNGRAKAAAAAAAPVNVEIDGIPSDPHEGGTS